MSTDDFALKITAITKTNPELNYTVKFVLPEGKVFIDGTARPNLISLEDRNADTIIEISLNDAILFLEGRLNVTMAFMTGKIKVHGSLGVALKMAQIAQKAISPPA